MEKCEFYKIKTERHYLTEFDKGFRSARRLPVVDYIDDTIEYCSATKDNGTCNYHGFTWNCNYYPEKRQGVLDTIKEISFYQYYLYKQNLVWDALSEYESWKKNVQKE